MSIVNMNKDMFDKAVVEEGKLVFVDYWAPWCVYCRRIAPALDKVAEQYGEQIMIAKVNIDEEGSLAQQEGIEVIPTMVMYQHGKAVDSIVAPDSKAKIEEFIKKYVG